MPKIAIIGAGYAGLASAYYLLQKGCQITIFDSGGGASRVSTGLMYGYPGEHARKSEYADLGIKETIHLLNVASDHLGKAVYQKKGIFRPAMIDKQKESFQKSLSLHPELIWWEKEKVQEMLPECIPIPGLYIENAYQVDSKLYTEGLLGYLQTRGVEYQKKQISSLDELSSFDSILVTGTLAFHNPGCGITKGQALICKSNRNFPCNISGKGHMSFANGICMLGSTYERDYQDDKPDLAKAISLKEQAALFFPQAKDLEVMECVSAFRIAKRGSYLPLIKRISEKATLFTGLGSRGLLYHALFASQLRLSS
ncbi:MAG TPA: FAD-dependent oxidoreductase [Chlamydiales bacterium]|nr:FAD-dependent oxidoreductase [Chlamydiales bacterium]